MCRRVIIEFTTLLSLMLAAASICFPEKARDLQRSITFRSTMGPGRILAKNQDHLVADMHHVKWDEMHKRPRVKDISTITVPLS